MKYLRHATFVKFLVLVAAFAIMNLGCSPETISDGCSQIELPFDVDTNVPDLFENMLELGRTVRYQNDFTTYAEFHEELFGITETTTEIVNAFEAHSQTYQTLGFEGYINDQVNESLIAEEFGSSLISFKNDLLVYLNNHPSLEALIAFFDTYRTDVAQSNLCVGDQQSMNTALDLAQGYAQYFYKHYTWSNDLQYRGCSFWEAIGCGLLAAVSTFIVTAFSLFIFFTNEANSGGSSSQSSDELAALASLAIGITVGVNVYQWCCGKDEIETQNCEAPTSVYWRQTDCNSFKYVIYGPSTYANTEWDNLNTDPSSLITNTSRLEFTVPTSGQPSDIHAFVTCVQDGSNVHIFEWEDSETFAQQSGELELTWEEPPPTSVSLSTHYQMPFPILVNAPTSTGTQHLSYVWEVTPPNTIDGSSNQAQVRFNSPGMAFTKVTISNSCTGESASISALTLVE